MKTKLTIKRSVQRMEAIKKAMRQAIEDQKKANKKPNP